MGLSQQKYNLSNFYFPFYLSFDKNFSFFRGVEIRFANNDNITAVIEGFLDFYELYDEVCFDFIVIHYYSDLFIQFFFLFLFFLGCKSSNYTRSTTWYASRNILSLNQSINQPTMNQKNEKNKRNDIVSFFVFLKITYQH